MSILSSAGFCGADVRHLCAFDAKQDPKYGFIVRVGVLYLWPLWAQQILHNPVVLLQQSKSLMQLSRRWSCWSGTLYQTIGVAWSQPCASAYGHWLLRYLPPL